MAIAGVVVVPAATAVANTVAEKLNSLNEASVQGVGDRGIAVVLEAADVGRLKKVSRAISEWVDVANLQVAYLNWEDAENRETE